MFSDLDIVLASASPRRAHMLDMLDISFEVIVSGVDEKPPAGSSPQEAALWAAREKALCVFESERRIRREHPRIVLACDTVVVYGTEVFGKPKDRSDARRMLETLSGKTHTVLSGVFLKSALEERSFVETTQVTFFALEGQLVEDYLDSGEYADKAGAYGIQGKAAIFVESIQGDYYNVVGLPLAKTLHELLDMENEAHAR